MDPYAHPKPSARVLQEDLKNIGSLVNARLFFPDPRVRTAGRVG